MQVQDTHRYPMSRTHLEALAHRSLTADVGELRHDLAATGLRLGDSLTLWGRAARIRQRLSDGLMNCMGTSVDYEKYYEQTNLIKVVDGKDVPVYGTTDAEKAEGHVVYTSSYGKVRSDANDGSFASKLYSFLTPTLLTVLNYVFLGLAVVGLVTLFVLTSRFTDKEKLRKARAQQSGASASMPKGAFNFDEDEK